MQEDAGSPPPPPRVHEKVVDVDRGPSSRALGITVVAGFAAAVLLMFALPKRDPHEVRLQPPIAPVAKQAEPAQAEPAPVVVNSDATPKPSAIMPAAVASTVPRTPRVEPPVRIDEQPAPVVEVTRNNPPPAAVGATSRAPIDLVVAPQMQPRDAEPPIVTSVMSREQLAPRPPPPEVAAKFTSD